VTAKFNREMEAATLNANTFILKAGSAVIAGGVSYADLTATFTPSAPLGADTLFLATITTGAKGIDGNPLASNRTWSFRTAGGAQTTPTILSNTPLDAALDVALNAAVTVTFSEAMEAALFSNSTFTLT